MRDISSDVIDAEISAEVAETLDQAAFDAADESAAADAVQAAEEALPGFDELGLSDQLLKAVENLGYTAPTRRRTSAA